MTLKTPVELSQKIDYLFQKISKIHTQIRRTDDLQLRLNFQEFIDSCIKQIVSIRDVNAPQSARKSQNHNNSLRQSQAYGKNNFQSQNLNDSKGKIYSTQTQRLQYEKKIVQLQMKQLQNRQTQMQHQTTKIQMINKQKQIQRLEEQKMELKRKHNEQMKRLVGRNNFVEQEIEKLVKLNKSQESQIKKAKEERNNAQRMMLQIQQKYDQQVGKLERFGQNNARYLDRNTEGLKCTRYYTNTTSSTGNQSQRIIILKLPVVIEVNKLVYGIMLGVQINNKQILYYDKFQLYQKQATKIELSGQSLVLSYKKRKQNVRIVLDKYAVRIPEVVVMLYGRGDSILVHENLEQKK